MTSRVRSHRMASHSSALLPASTRMDYLRDTTVSMHVQTCLSDRAPVDSSNCGAEHGVPNSGAAQP